MSRTIVFLCSLLAASRAVLNGAPATSDPITSHDRAEVARLRAHFDSVDRELREVRDDRFTASQRQRRAVLVAWLREYRHAGRFPQNQGESDGRVPIFRDRHGTLCAMAYLVDRSGRSDIVERVATRRNLAHIAELVDDTALVTWLRDNGLSVAEAARIQPEYRPPPTGKSKESRTWPSLVLIGVDATATGFMLKRPSTPAVTIGLLSGVASLAVGTSHLNDTGNARRVAQVTTAVGAITTGIGFYRAVTPNSWQRQRLLGRAMALLDDVTAGSIQRPSGEVVPAFGVHTAFR